MKIAVFEVESWEHETFEALKAENEVLLVNEPLTSKNVSLFTDADIISPFIYSDLKKTVLDGFKNLKLIATRSTGYDHIDLDYCSKRGIAVSNVPFYGENTVAEHVFGLLLTISHNLAEAVERTRKGDFSQTGLRGFDLMGKKLGVIGVGGIGRHVIEIAKGFGMEPIAFDVRPDLEFAAKAGFTYKSLDKVLAESDIITLHVPVNEKTVHMISAEQFSKMKDGVVIINTSRGGIMDVQALLRALADGKVAAAGLDVLEEEPAIREEAELLSSIFRKKYNLKTALANNILLHLRNVVITPHSAFNTREAVQRILKTTFENIDAFISGRPQNLVRQLSRRKAA
jgi:D-lactate dehydrogenase